MFFLFLIPFEAEAQNHYEFWSKLAIEKKLDTHWSVGFDAQHRLQSNYILNRTNPFKYRLFDNIRVWVNYKTSIGTVVVSPYALFRNYDLNTDGFINHKDEWRMAIGIQKSRQTAQLELAGRFLAEHRQSIVDNNGFDRVRFQIRLRPMVFGKGHSNFQPYIQEEYFYRVNGYQSVFDQNRIQTGIKHKKERWDINFAYQNTTQHPNQLHFRHQIYTSLQYTIQLTLKKN
ncbi:MAG: DUF2490 domain-containing protein [Bacteroidia bacterium]|nr:DUF2490 domain-containing protein [Bacteroidia bacterium]